MGGGGGEGVEARVHGSLCPFSPPPNFLYFVRNKGYTFVIQRNRAQSIPFLNLLCGQPHTTIIISTLQKVNCCFNQKIGCASVA